QLVQLYREIGALHLAAENVVQGLSETTWRIDVPIAARRENRGEERKALNVIPVRMADQEMPVQFLGGDQLASQNGSAGARVDYDQRTRIRANQHAGCVSAIADGMPSRRGQRTPGAVKPYQHG